MWDTGCSAEVFEGLASLERSTKEDGVLASGVSHGKLIECKALTTALGDTAAGAFSEAKSSNAKTRNINKTNIICDCANKDSNLTFLSLHETREFAKSERSTNAAALHKTMKNNTIEFR